MAGKFVSEFDYYKLAKHLADFGKEIPFSATEVKYMLLELGDICWDIEEKSKPHVKSKEQRHMWAYKINDLHDKFVDDMSEELEKEALEDANDRYEDVP